MSNIPLTAREPISFTPSALIGTKKEKVKIKIRVPTLMERDQYAAMMVRSGVIFYTRQQIRDFTLAGVQTVFPADEQDEKTALLEEFWQVSDEEMRVAELQGRKLLELYDRAKVQQRKADHKAVQKELNKIKPTIAMDKNRKILAAGVASEVASQYEPVRRAMAALTEADSKRSYLNVRTFVMGWTGLEHNLKDPPGAEGLELHEAEYLRQEIGEDAWTELSDKITSMQGISEDEEKNSDSPLANTTEETGSIQTDQSTVNNASGDSTDEPSTPTPESE